MSSDMSVITVRQSELGDVEVRQQRRQVKFGKMALEELTLVDFTDMDETKL